MTQSGGRWANSPTACTPTTRDVQPRVLRGEEIVERAAAYGFTGEVLRIERAWPSHPGYELNFIRNRAWSALRRLDDHDYNRVAGPAIAALEALPQEETI